MTLFSWQDRGLLPLSSILSFMLFLCFVDGLFLAVFCTFSLARRRCFWGETFINTKLFSILSSDNEEITQQKKGGKKNDFI